MPLPYDWQNCFWALALTGLICTAVQWDIWWRNKSASPLILYWGGFSLSAAAAATLMALGASSANWMLILPAPMFALFAAASALAGARAAQDRPSLLGLFALPAIGWPILVVASSLLFDDSEWLISLNVFLALIWAITTAEIWHGRRVIPFARWLSPLFMFGTICALTVVLEDKYLSPALINLSTTQWIPMVMILGLALSAIVQNGSAAPTAARAPAAARLSPDTERLALAATRMASIGQMASALAHEMRQPLTVIGLALDNLDHALERQDIRAARDRIPTIGIQVERAAWLIEHLRLFARGGSAGQGITNVAIRPLLDDTMRLVGEAMRLSSIELSLDLAELPAMAKVDANALQQVLVMLLLNARDVFNERRTGDPRRVVVRSAPGSRPGTVLLTITDTAGGIEQGVMERLFQPFTTNKADSGAAGLGLSICKRLVTTMGGEITARNEGAGAVFSLELPSA